MFTCSKRKRARIGASYPRLAKAAAAPELERRMLAEEVEAESGEGEGEGDRENGDGHGKTGAEDDKAAGLKRR